MEKRVSKNVGDLLSISSKNFFASFGRGLVGTFLYVLPLIVLVALMVVFKETWAYLTFGLIGIVLFGPMQFGYTRFANRLYAGEKPCVLSVYKYFIDKRVVGSALFGAVLIAMYLFGFVLLVIPGLIVIAFYSMVPFFAEKYQDKGFYEIFKISHVRTRGSRVSMMSYKAIFYALFFALFVLGGFASYGVVELASSSLVVSVVAGIVCGISILFLLCVLISFYHSTNYIQFNEIELCFEKMQKKEEAKQAKAEEKAEEKTEEKAEEKTEEKTEKSKK